MTAQITTPMASSDTSPVRYHVTGPDGNFVQLSETYTVTTAGIAVTYLAITNGGSTILLSKQNASDLAAGFTNFGTNGVLS